MTDFIIQNRKLLSIVFSIIVAAAILKYREGEWISIIKPKYIVKKYFFTYSENHFYTSLKKVLYYNYWYKYEVYPKVRLADIFQPEKGDNWIKKLRMRHVDFLIVDKEQDFQPILAIELDWDSHKEYIQYKSDKFKNEVFKDSNLPLIRFNNNVSDNQEIIKSNIIQYLGTPTKQPN